MASEVKALDILRVHACMGIIIVIQANLACVFDRVNPNSYCSNYSETVN